MLTSFLIMFIITAGITWLWTSGISKADTYKKENPHANMAEGWLDWDCDTAHTEGEL